MKIVIGGVAGLLLAPILFVGAVTGALGSSPLAAIPAASGLNDIPENMLVLYLDAAQHFDIPAPILAGIGKVECDHDRDPACARPNAAGAVGPMQFLPSTFAQYAWASGNPDPSITNEHDAVFAAAAMLLANGVNTDSQSAIFAYNHSQTYVNEVLQWATTYADIGSLGAVVVAIARSYLGVPYVWGGTTSAGIDCSGLVLVSYAAVGVAMPRVAQDQSQVGITVPSLADMRPGDLLFYGTSPDAIDHVTIATGNGADMIEAPHTGTVVREVPIRSDGLVVTKRVLS